MTKRGLVLGCGGTVGGAWQVGALAAVEEFLDWDARTADVIIGTSGGSTAATMLGAGAPVSELVDAQFGRPSAREPIRTFFTKPPSTIPAIPFGLPSSVGLALGGLRRRSRLEVLAGLAPAGRSNPDFVDMLVDGLVPGGGWVDHPATWIVAADLATGKRVAFGSPGAPSADMRDAVRASWAIPGWYPPVKIDGRRYIDGGAVSTGSADLLAHLGLDEVVIVAPMASQGGEFGHRAENLIRTAMSPVLHREVKLLEAAGTRVIRVHPTVSELRTMGMNYMDPRRRLPALETALANVPNTLRKEALQ
ncbi:MAG: patatin-like phospholipase family protein [Nocardiaceae bacterium]|nr:patatin-like phospholipase family protein [Nocardiaceae bacterium]